MLTVRQKRRSFCYEVLNHVQHLTFLNFEAAAALGIEQIRGAKVKVATANPA